MPGTIETTNRLGQWVQTYQGKAFWPLDPWPNEVDIVDIAHALSLQCRFAGHCESFYSVAEHALRVSYIVPPADALWGLLHDASEAYLVDVPRPVKPYLRGYKEIEAAVMAAICVRFDLPSVMPKSVHTADAVLLMTEARDLMKRPPMAWNESGVRPLTERITPMTSQAAEAKFLARFEELSRKRIAAALPTATELQNPDDSGSFAGVG